MQFSETKRREMQIIREQRRRRVTESQTSLVSDFRAMWMQLRDLLTCQQKASVHHFHHHEHFHIHHHTIRCEQCNVFCRGAQPETVSPKEIYSDNGNSIPKVEISCFDDEYPNHSQLQRRFSISCPSLSSTDTNRAVERKLSINSGQQSFEQEIRLANNQAGEREQLKMPRLLTPLKNKSVDPKPPERRVSDVSSTLSIHAESIASISIEKKQSPQHASLRTKTSLSLLVNGTSAQVRTKAYCEANASIRTEPGSRTTLEAKTSNSVRLQTPVKQELCKSPSNTSKYSNASDNRSEDMTDFADTSSEALYGSMFDLRYADKYYVSVQPNFFQKFRRNCKKLSESRKFSHLIMIIIVLNTISMGVEHHNQVAIDFNRLLF